MPERLSRASVTACAVLAAAVFGGAFALAHGGPAKPAPAPASPTAIRLANAPVGTLHRASPLPALRVPRPRPKPAQPQPTVTVPLPAVQAPAPAPSPRRPAPAKPPVTFDDSG